jgi:hypothetical protein
MAKSMPIKVIMSGGRLLYKPFLVTHLPYLFGGEFTLFLQGDGA